MAAKALERISYVEDDSDIREIVGIALAQIGGFSVDLCDSGQAAIERVPEFKPDLILLDVMMPGMDGVETFGRLRTIPELNETPIVFMTANSMQHDLEKYHALGAADVITKPFDPMSLPEKIQDIWRSSKEGRKH